MTELCLRASATAGFKFLILLLLLSLILCSAAPLLPVEEVEALRVIASKLGYSGWRVARDSCSGGGLSRIINADDKGLRSGGNVTCNCTNTVCHITNIQLKRLNLTGVLPEEFADLTYLREIDLTLNYINGTIPPRVGQLPLSILSLLGNRISGSIPGEIGDIATLEELVLEDNLLGGPLPENIGHLTRLRRLILSSNNFTGTIPKLFGNLTNLEDFRIDGSVLSGRIPDFIGNWTKLNRLDLQGTSMEGPIPSTISMLKNLTELRISDLIGLSSTSFPNLEDMKKMKMLHLRNCFLTGSIPGYLGQMGTIKKLDLSFNRLNGTIPESFRTLDFDFLFLNDNLLTGDIPRWIFDSTNKIDISYNNFTRAPPQNCRSSGLNLVSALSSSVASNTSDWCLTNKLTCNKKPDRHSLFINCGGPRLDFDGKEYEEDLINEESFFYFASERWAYSSTGVFMGNQDGKFVAETMNVIGGEIYRTARLSPTSLRYYGLCLRRGTYKVRLHFAEIMYSDDMTFSSLGKRIFDVSIQGVLQLKDFNIMKEANGVGRGIYKEFDNVIVNGSTMEIHLYWAGKGTTAIPDRGVYGHLISAIAITPNFDISTGLSAGAIAGIVICSCTVVVLILVGLRKAGYLGGDKEDKGKNSISGFSSLYD